jgi:alpha-methylacyl-CoA racemase
VVGLLSAVRVLDLSAVGPASRAAGILADYGAQVTKVLRPRDRVGDSFEPDESLYGGGRNVRRVRVDLAHEDGRDVLLRLADGVDVVLESFRPGVADRLGIGAAVLRARNPRLVYCSTSGYGRAGPYAAWAGHDLNYLGLAGLLAHGDRRGDGGPPVPGATIGDAAGGGMHAVIAVLAALLGRDGSGVGTELDVPVLDGSLWLMSLALDEWLRGAEPDSPMRLLTGRFACYSTYAARDGRWLSVAALEPRFWRNLCESLDVPDLIGCQHDEDRQPEVKARLAAVFVTRDRDDWVARLGPADTCVAPVHTLDEVAQDPHLRARGLFSEVAVAPDRRHERLSPLLAGAERTSPPLPDSEDATRGVLVAAGFTAAEARSLRERGIVE